MCKKEKNRITIDILYHQYSNPYFKSKLGLKICFPSLFEDFKTAQTVSKYHAHVLSYSGLAWLF